jgi:phage terminase Nu1 subunit (DNA packaging protein)
MSDAPVVETRQEVLRGVVSSLLADLKNGVGDKDRRRQVEEWMRGLAEKYPEFAIETGLRDYYLAEAQRLRAEFEKSSDIAEKLGLGRSIESFLDRAAEYERRVAER